MSRISDMIEKFINELINSSKGSIEIQRNELANYFSCAPSQINYVLTTRFTTDRGYSIESRRGGGGCIRITRVIIDGDEFLEQILSEGIGNNISKTRACEMLRILLEKELLDKRSRDIIKAVIDDNTLSIVPIEFRDFLRAQIMKSAIIAALING